MKKVFLLILALCLMLSLCACGGDSAEETTGATVEEVTEAPVADVVEETTEAPAETEATGIGYTVNVVDEGGNPITGVMVQICQGELCMMPAATNESGVATFSVVEVAEYEAKLLSLPAGYEYVTEEHVFPFGNAFELTITLKAVA